MLLLGHRQAFAWVDEWIGRSTSTALLVLSLTNHWVVFSRANIIFFVLKVKMNECYLLDKTRKSLPVFILCLMNMAQVKHWDL